MLFSSELNPKNEEIRELIAISQNLDFDKLKPGIEAVERDYLKPLIGTAMLAALQTFYDTGSTDTDSGSGDPVGSGSGDPDNAEAEANELIWSELLTRCKRAVINLAFFINFDILNVIIDDAGFGRTENENRKGLYKYQEDNLRLQFKTDGFNSFDEILSYLHENISVFTIYASSTEYTRYKTAIFKNTIAFDTVYYINKSNLTFRRLTQYITLVEDTVLKKLCGDILWGYIKEEMADESTDADIVALLPYIQKPLAYLAVAYLMEDTGAELTENGLYFQAWAAVANNQLIKQTTPSDRINMLVTRSRDIGNSYLAELKVYLNTNITKWPTFTNTHTYLHNRDNTNKKTFWV